MKHPRIVMIPLAVLALLMFASATQAASINDLIGGPPGAPSTLIEADDNDAEWIAVDGNANGKLDVGDVLEGVMRVTELEVNGFLSGLDGADNNQWYGHFALEVTSKTYVATVSGVDLYNIGFGVYDAFDEDTAGNLPFGVSADGTVLRMFEHSVVAGTGDVIQFNVKEGLETDAAARSRIIGEVIGGRGLGSSSTYYWSLGLDSGWNGWVALGVSDNPGLLPAQGIDVTNAYFAVNRTSETWANSGLGKDWKLLTRTTGVPGFTGAGEFIGSIALSQAPSSSAWEVSSTLKGSFKIAPLPVAAYPGFALLAGFFALTSYRRRRAA
jgi:hypothetical protein